MEVRKDLAFFFYHSFAQWTSLKYLCTVWNMSLLYKSTIAAIPVVNHPETPIEKL